jgi:hypothetical protein
MNDPIFVLHKCDCRHTTESMETIAFCSTKEKAIDLVVEQAKNEGYQIHEHDLYLLRTISQTQYYEGSGEFMITEHLQDTLI